MSATLTRLTTQKIWSLSSVPKVLEGSQTGNVVTTPMVLVPRNILSCCNFWLVIPEGVFAMVTSHGKYIGIWEAGLHFCHPWQQVSYLVTRQYVVFDCAVKQCPTKDNTMVEIDVSLVLKVNDEDDEQHGRKWQDNVRDFVFKIGPERLDQMLQAYQEEAVRTMARSKTYDQIYDLVESQEYGDIEFGDAFNKGRPGGGGGGEGEGEKKVDVAAKLLDKLRPDHDEHEANLDHHEQLETAKEDLNNVLRQYGIKVTSITITNVRLPDVFAKEMESSTTYQSKNAYQAVQQQYQLIVIEDKEKQAQLTQRLVEEREELRQRNGMELARERFQNAEIEAETRRMAAELREKLDAKVGLIEADSRLKVAELTKQRVELEATVMADAKLAATKIEAEARAFETVKAAQADLGEAEHTATCIQESAKAESDSSKDLQSKRDYLEKQARLRALNGLGLNPDVLVVTSGQNDTDALLVTSGVHPTLSIGNNNRN
eukprot:TRINITY_DN105231_c0_g1_i1.p1 TRINITY_DN105231_c0_g1~~TRINITY_DN105231_c0_g1_i1.p1  ORF type:complete len:501 (+),score=273.58 TRINITY_DN105231_c0_g1_i1:44-1504(+)